MKSIHAVFVQPVHILHLVVTLGCFRGRKKKQRSICFQAAWMVHCFAPVSHFSFLARQIGAFPFPLRLLYDKVICGLYVAMYQSTFLLFIYLFILTADGFKPLLSNNPPHRQYRKKYFRSSVENSINALILSRFLPISANGLVSKTAFR